MILCRPRPPLRFRPIFQISTAVLGREKVMLREWANMSQRILSSHSICCHWRDHRLIHPDSTPQLHHGPFGLLSSHPDEERANLSRAKALRSQLRKKETIYGGGADAMGHSRGRASWRDRKTTWIMPAALTIRRALAATPGSISYSVEKRNRNFLALHTLYVNVWPPLHRAPPPFRFQTVTHQHMVNEGACGTASFIRFPLPSSVTPVTPSPPPHSLCTPPPVNTPPRACPSFFVIAVYW